MFICCLGLPIGWDNCHNKNYFPYSGLDQADGENADHQQPGALEETLPAPDQWPQTVIGDPKQPALALLVTGTFRVNN